MSENNKPDCSNHKRDLMGETDMKKVAEAFGDLHYEVLPGLLFDISRKFKKDAQVDYDGGREKLAAALQYLELGILECAYRAERLLEISKPFMTKPPNNGE